MLKSPGHIAFSIFSIDVYWYGIIMSLSILIGLLVVLKIRDKFYKEIAKDNIFDLTFHLIIIGILFARIYYVILDYKYFSKHLFEIFAIWTGGISIHGAIIGGILAVYLYAKEQKENFFKYADLLTFGLISGQIIGRWGNFFNSEAFGLPTNLPWKMHVPYLLRPIEYKQFEYFHPTFLYESILNIFVLIILYLILCKKQNRKTGTIFFTYLTLYSIVRMIIETIRIDSILNIGSFHFAHIACIFFFIVGVMGLYFVNKTNKYNFE